MELCTMLYPSVKKGKVKGIKGSFVIGNDRGLHTRPSTEIVRCASRFSCVIKLTHQKLEVNARSLLGVLMLAAPKGAKIGIIAEGEDAEEAILALQELAKKNFNIKY